MKVAHSPALHVEKNNPGDTPGRKVIPALEAPVMETLRAAGERLGGRQLTPATRNDICALLKKTIR